MNKYSEHVMLLCEKHDITVGSHSRGGRAFRKSRLVNIRPVKSAITYAVALHEIGHVLGKKQSSSYSLEKETYAWLWAIDNAIEWSPTMEKKMAKCMQSYVDWAESRQYRKVPPRLPPANHPLWELI